MEAIYYSEKWDQLLLFTITSKGMWYTNQNETRYNLQTTDKLLEYIINKEYTLIGYL
jgi:hypothetical protein